MTQKPAPQIKKQTLKGALFDLLILLLMLCAAGFGGYFYGTHQKLAVVDLVAPGTPDAREMPTTPARTPAAKAPAESAAPSSSVTKTTAPTAPTEEQSKPAPATATKPAPTTATTTPGKMKYWLASTGDRMVGYSISAQVNGTPVDNFFAPGKQVNVTDLVKKGQNTVMFQATALDEKFNLHKGEKQFGLTVQLVRGPAVSENFRPTDVLAKYRRNAAETQSFSEEMDFTVE